MENIKTLLLENGIDQYGVLNFERVKIINPRLLPDKNIQSVLFVLLPYRTGKVRVKDDYNMGLFARLKDYHLVFNALAERLAPELKRLVGGEVYYFADHSPIHEKDGARQCGLGFIGKNSLLINPTYGSFVFIGCFLFTERLKERIFSCDYNCGNCNLCRNACKGNAIGTRFDKEKCLSAISQKKRKNEEEKAILKSTRTIWGCDLCQNLCPYNANAKHGEISAFDEGVLENISAEIICKMDDKEYKKYAFSFREKEVLLENFLTVDGECDIIN